ncbi:MAG: hypothetical protein QOH81_3380 [Sphingomonadales bacterium]|jgi:predicted glycoside hydrolase/deacetylase ChbG (UPF0249 family)|nr:hypothetical protein [Sphingomonadales bacterium]
MRRLILCADDFGDGEAATEAILALAGKRRINAATVMVGGGEAAAGAPLLARTADVAIGLHLTLSGGGDALARSALAPEGRLPHVDRLTAAAFAGRLPLAAISAEIERQYDRFELLFDRAPDFVDAHQHSHMLPGIRRIFLDTAARRAPDAWVRTCEDRLQAIVGRGVYPWLAARSSLLSSGLARQAAAKGLQTNTSFAGLYNFRHKADYPAMFRRWLTSSASLHLLICHPAAAHAAGPVAASRARELDFLAAAPIDMLAAAAGLAWWTPREGRSEEPDVPAAAA